MKNTKPNQATQQISIKSQINKLLLIIVISMLVIIGALIALLVSISRQYTSALQNANIAADFNKEFKETLDLEMHNHVIKPRDEQSLEELPLKELDNAVEVLHRLQATTTLRDNRWRISSMLNMCENLRGYMVEIAKTNRYDERMELLERNIRGEAGLTVLIETYMHDYIDDEVRELARLQGEIGMQVTVVIIGAVTVVILLIVLVLLYSVRLVRRITEPIGALAEKAQKLGEGDFSITPIVTNSAELQTLDKGFDEMIGHINALMEKQIEDQKYLHRAELELLQAQINPHFLYNTLDSIVILAENHQTEEVIEMVTSLSVFFRNSLSKGRNIITLRAELDQVTSYLDIQKIRYSDILKYKIQIPDELLGCMVPKLILQPLVENALYHGTKNKRGLGTILIKGKCLDGDMLLQVKDDGAGMDEERVKALQAGVYEDRQTGLGLVNVHKRIKLYCGEKYGLSFESVLGEGTVVSVLLPKNIQANAKEEHA